MFRWEVELTSYDSHMYFDWKDNSRPGVGEAPENFLKKVSKNKAKMMLVPVPAAAVRAFLDPDYTSTESLIILLPRIGINYYSLKLADDVVSTSSETVFTRANEWREKYKDVLERDEEVEQLKEENQQLKQDRNTDCHQGHNKTGHQISLER